MSAYFLLLIISILYSSNKEQAITRIIQLSPLLIIPFIIFFTNIDFSKKIKYTVLIVFVFANIIYTLSLLYMFFSHIDNWDYTLSYYVFSYDMFQYDLNKSIQNNAIFIHKPYFSMGFVISAIFCLKMFFNRFSKRVFIRVLYFFAVIYFSLWIFYAFSFPNVIALFLSITFLLYKELSKNYFFITMTAFLIFSSIIIAGKLNDIDVQRGFNFMKTVVNNQEYEVNDNRGEIYKSYKNIAQNSSFSEILFGFGVGDVQDKLNAEYNNRLHENRSNNLLYFSEEFNNSYWFKNKVEIVPNKIISPTAKVNADLMIANIDDAKHSHNICVKTIKKEGLYTFSIYAKKDKSQYIILRLGDIDQRATFDIQKGKIIKKKNIVEAKIYRLDNDWYRCFIAVHLKQDGLALIGLSNQKGDYVYKNKTTKSTYLWGAQLEEGTLTTYDKNRKELLQVTLDEELNTHNNYLYFLMATGILGLLLFLITILYLFKISLKSRNILQLSFCIIITLNFLTENILSRHWGLLFISFMAIVLFTKEKTNKNII
ncbi:MAG: phage head spike fiber domain-containing protein [Polaribacter sp.]